MGILKIRTIKAIFILLFTIIFKILSSPVWIVIWSLNIIEKTIRIVKETITFFIKQIESEVFK